MLNIDKCIELARNTCINMFGQDFVKQHKADFSSLQYEDKDLHRFEYSLLYAPLEEVKENGMICIGGEPFDYYVSVIVDMVTGVVYPDSDPAKTKLPA